MPWLTLKAKAHRLDDLADFPGIPRLVDWGPMRPHPTLTNFTIARGDGVPGSRGRSNSL